MSTEHLFGRNLVSTLVLLAIGACSCERASCQNAKLHAGSPASQINSSTYLDLSKADSERQRAYPGSETARAQHYDLKAAPPLLNATHSSNQPMFLPHLRYDYGAGFDPLHIKDASLIIVGFVKSVTEHLSSKGTSVYSTFDFQPTQTIKGMLALGDIELERQGGVVMFPSGEKRYVGVLNFGLPLPGHIYMLMLAPSSTTSKSYLILGGYGLDNSTIVSLDREGHKFDRRTPPELEALIRQRLAQ